MGAIGKRLFAEEQEADREQSRARGDENKDKNQDVTQVLLSGPGSEFIGRCGYDCQPRQGEHRERECVPGDDAAGGGLQLTGQGEPGGDRDNQRNDNAMPRILFPDPVHRVDYAVIPNEVERPSAAIRSPD
jgi:hypothetical protein